MFVCAFASHDSTAQLSTANQVQYVDILPPSPGAASISNLNHSTVNVATGAASLNIPITALAAGNFNVPISLSYQASGFKVDEIGSRAGFGFQLEAGGAITRVVNGAIDEYATFLQLPANTNTSSREFLTYLESFDNTTSHSPNDSQPDDFNFSFCGYSGKFVLDEARNPVLIPKSNLKIEIKSFSPTAAVNFVIYDSDGNKFSFGGPNAIERSKKEVTCSKAYDSDMTTAWFLKKIETVTGHIITFSYLPVTYTYDLGINQTMSYGSPSNGEKPQECPSCPNYGNDVCVNFIKTSTMYLQSISSSQRSIHFYYSSRNDCSDKLLNSISVFSQGGSESDNYIFYHDAINSTLFGNPYTTAVHGYRYFLKKIERVDNASNFLPMYLFEYNDLNNLPVRMSYAQDHWGYFNGQSNTTLIPKPSDAVMAAKFPLATANRETNGDYAKKGLLNKITYPTGGYDVIEYESNTIFEEDVPSYPADPSTVSGDVTGSGFSTQVTYTSGNFLVGYVQSVHVAMQCDNTTGGTVSQHHVGKLQIIRVSDNAIMFEKSLVPGNFYSGDPELLPGTYNVKLTAVGSITKLIGSVVYIPGTVTYQDINKPVGGVRVSRLSQHLTDGSIAKAKYYYYANLATPTESNGKLNFQPYYSKSFFKRQFFMATCPPGPTCNELMCRTFDCTYVNMFSSSINTLYGYGGRPVVYPAVIESDDPGFSNGLTYNEFYLQPDSWGTLLLGSNFESGYPLTNQGVTWNGKPKSQSIYKREGGLNVLTSKTRYTYQLPTSIPLITGVVVTKRFPGFCYKTLSGTPHEEEFINYEAYRYSIMGPWMVEDSVITERYEGNTMMKTYSKYSYANEYSMLPTRIETTNSDSELEVVQNYFPHDKAGISGLTSGELAILDTLVARNMYSPLIAQVKTLNGNFNGKYLATYNKFSNNEILPASIKNFFVGNVTGKAFYMTSYDELSNVTERYKDDEVLFSYVWDYNKAYPVAEVKGASQSEIAYTSFEAQNDGSWAIQNGVVTSDATAPTGVMVMNLSNGSLQRTQLSPSKSFNVSYWYKSGSSFSVAGASNVTTRIGKDGWTFVTCTLSGVTTITISGTGFIDEARICPVKSLMLTYTYSPLKGVTSITDSNGMVVYYEYDSFNRLIRIKDDKGNLVQSFEYKYYKPEVSGE